MPYIDKKERPRFDTHIDALMVELNKSKTEKQDGQVNYIFFKILKNLYAGSYFQFNRAMEVISCVAKEFYRRRIAPFEDKKIKERGDVE